MSRKYSAKSLITVGAIAVLFLGVFLSVHTTQQKQETKSHASVGVLKPQGTYTNWKWSSQGYSSLDTYLTIESDPTKTNPGLGYYWSNQFHMVEEGGYMGIQTQGEAGDFRGKVAIFALWDAKEVENGSPGSNCTYIPNGFDGGSITTNGSTCRIPLNWQAGETYHLRLSAISENATTRTWRATVQNQATGQELVIGNIRTRLSYGKLNGWLSNWTEYYSAGRAECDAPYSKIIFGTPKLDSTIAPISHTNDFGSATNACTNSAFTELAQGVRQEQGNPAVNGELPVLPSGGTYISDLNWTSATTGYGEIKKDQRVAGEGLIILAGRTFEKGIGTHAVSEIKYALNGNYSRFVSYVNIQDSAGGTVAYEVWADGARLFDSGTMNGGSSTKAVNVDVSGKQELKLVVTDAGDGNGADWAAWADARLIPNNAPVPTATPIPNIVVPTKTPTPTPTSGPNLVVVSLTARVKSVDDRSNLLNGSIKVGQTITGYYAYNASTQDENTFSYFGDYRHKQSPYGIFLQSGGLKFETDPNNVNFLLELVNDYDGRVDKVLIDNYVLQSYGNKPLNSTLSVGNISWQLDDLTHQALSSTALPSTPPVLSQWQSDFGLTIMGNLIGSIDPYGYLIRADVISVDKLSGIPTPTPTLIPTATATPVPSLPTATPTSPPLPTSIIAPNATALSLNLFLHGIGKGGDSSNPNSGGSTPSRIQRSVTVDLSNGSNQLVLTKSGTVNLNSVNGNFTGLIDLGSTLPTGVYIVKIKSDQFLKTLVPGIQTITQGQTNFLPQARLVTGDINNDNKVNILDYTIILDCYSDLSPARNCADPAKKQSADLTDDGSVNQFDYNLFLRELTNIQGE